MSNTIQDALKAVDTSKMPGSPAIILDIPSLPDAGCTTIQENSNEVLQRIFCLDYKAGQVIRSMYFAHKNSDLYSAIEEAKLFCIKMRYRFIFVHRFLTSLDEEVLRAQQQGRI